MAGTKRTSKKTPQASITHDERHESRQEQTEVQRADNETQRHEEEAEYNELWGKEDDETCERIEHAEYWDDASRMLYAWLRETDQPGKRIFIARWARINFSQRLAIMGSFNKSMFKAAYDDLKEQMDRIIASADAELIAEQKRSEEERNGPVSSAMKIRVVSSLADVVRIFDAMKDAGIISEKTPVQTIVDLFFVEGSTAKNMLANVNATRKSIREGSKARGNAMVAFAKILGEQLTASDRDELVAHLQHFKG